MVAGGVPIAVAAEAERVEVLLPAILRKIDMPGCCAWMMANCHPPNGHGSDATIDVAAVRVRDLPRLTRWLDR